MFVTLFAGCGGVYHGIEGNISNSQFADNGKYEANSECIWDIISPGGYQLQVSFVDAFDVETSDNCGNDFVQVCLFSAKIPFVVQKLKIKVIKECLSSLGLKLSILNIFN